MVSRRRLSLILCGLIAAGVPAACGGTDSAPPVASVSLTVNKDKVAVGSVLDLTYRFQVLPGAAIGGDYRVFAHLTRDDGTTIWTDDHELPADIRTSTWQPGQVIEYTRTRFVPTFSYLGTATFEVGLYRDDERLPLAVADGGVPASRAYRVAAIELLPRSENISIYQLSGWHPVEFAAGDPTVEWQWTQKVATLSLRNPRADLTLYLEFDTRRESFGTEPQQVSVYAGDTQVATFPADASAPAIRRIPLSAAQLGEGEMAELRIEVDRTFVPARLPDAGQDERELGIRVYHVHVEPVSPES